MLDDRDRIFDGAENISLFVCGGTKNIRLLLYCYNIKRIPESLVTHLKTLQVASSAGTCQSAILSTNMNSSCYEIEFEFAI